jgi:4-hydroxybutyrate CoA-transferase
MNGWIHQYQRKITTAEEAVKVIQSGQRVFLTGNCSVPQKVLAALVARAPELHNVEIAQVLTVGPADYQAWKNICASIPFSSATTCARP